MSAQISLPNSAPRAVRLISLVVVLLVGLTGLIGFSPPANAADATITGRFVTESGVPIDAISADLVQNSTLIKSVTAGADGTFSLTGVVPGSYTLENADPYYNYFASGKAITVADGETKALGDIKLSFSAAIPPNTKLTGFVRDPSGKPVRGVQVLAKNSAVELEPNDPANVGGFGVTDRSGRYSIDSDGGGGLPEPGTYKLAFTQRVELDAPFAVDRRYSGNQPTWARATTVTIDSTLQTVPDVTVVRNGGISGTITGTPALTNGTATVYDVDGEQVATKATSNGAYSITTLRPGSYYVRFSSTDGGGSKFVRTFWPGAASITGATRVVVTSGAFRTGVNQVLSDQLTAFGRPTISGRPVVGATLTAVPGSWSLTSLTEYSYQWLRAGGVIPAATARTYRPVAADAGKTLSVRVTARNLDKMGTSTSPSTATVKHVSTVTARSAYNRLKRKLVLTVRVTVPGLANPGGTVTVKKGSRTIKSGVAVRNGIAVITILRPSRGTYTFGLRYSGTTTVLPDTGAIRVTVR